jgi:opacity protein-like surface antigen
MLRKLACALCLVGASSAYAGAVYLGPSVVYESITTANAGFGGIGPRLSLGYEELVTDKIYFAGEVFANPATFKLFNNPAPKGSLRVTYSYGGSVLPGYNLDNTIIAYGRLGFIRSRFSNVDEVKGGFQYGLGLQYVISEYWSVRGDYTRTTYSSINFLGDPKSDQYMAGLMYRFC